MLLVSLASLSDLRSVPCPVRLPVATLYSSYLFGVVSEMDLGNGRLNLFSFGAISLGLVLALQSASSLVSVLVHTMSGRDGMAS